MDARERVTLFAREIARARSDEEPVTFVAGAGAAGDREDGDGDGSGPRVTFEDRLVRFDLDPAGREGLSELLGEFPVFKHKQPETRKAPAGTVYVSAVADAKRVADFLEAAFRGPLGRDAEFDVRARREGSEGGEREGSGRS